MKIKQLLNYRTRKKKRSTAKEGNEPRPVALEADVFTSEPPRRCSEQTEHLATHPREAAASVQEFHQPADAVLKVPNARQVNIRSDGQRYDHLRDARVRWKQRLCQRSLT